MTWRQERRGGVRGRLNRVEDHTHLALQELIALIRDIRDGSTVEFVRVSDGNLIEWLTSGKAGDVAPVGVRVTPQEKGAADGS